MIVESNSYKLKSLLKIFITTKTTSHGLHGYDFFFTTTTKTMVANSKFPNLQSLEGSIFETIKSNPIVSGVINFIFF